MKFEELLMLKEEERNQKKLQLEAEVAQLQEILENEQKLNTVLHRALNGSFVCHSCLSSSSSSSSVSLQAQILVAEIAKVEEEVIYLQKKVEEMKQNLHQERKNKKESLLQWEQKLQTHPLSELGSHGITESSTNMEKTDQIPFSTETKTFLELVAEAKEKEADQKTENLKQQHRVQRLRSEDSYRGEQNKLSEQLIRILVSIFKKLIVPQNHIESEASTAPKLNMSCIRSSNSRASATATFMGTQIQDPYCILSEGDIGPYKKFLHLTSGTLDLNRIVLCLPAIEKLRVLIQKLSVVELQSLCYKQRLAFWINIYNASIMNAFLQHGLPTSPEKLLELLNKVGAHYEMSRAPTDLGLSDGLLVQLYFINANQNIYISNEGLPKAAFNVGGIVLNALAIEHFILRQSSNIKDGIVDEKEAQLRRTYGLRYPQPNITFALCRGSFSSPALRVYTAENVVNELERAKVEFLEASICITSKKKIVIPKLLQWHMLDFAEDIESLIEWIYSQLPRFRPLKRLMMQWLSPNNRICVSKLVEIRPYNAEFRYLLSDH